jgi:hypothetical protein
MLKCVIKYLFLGMLSTVLLSFQAQAAKEFVNIKLAKTFEKNAGVQKLQVHPYLGTYAKTELAHRCLFHDITSPLSLSLDHIIFGNLPTQIPQTTISIELNPAMMAQLMPLLEQSETYEISLLPSPDESQIFLRLIPNSKGKSIFISCTYNLIEQFQDILFPTEPKESWYQIFLDFLRDLCDVDDNKQTILWYQAETITVVDHAHKKQTLDHITAQPCAKIQFQRETWAKQQPAEPMLKPTLEEEPTAPQTQVQRLIARFEAIK